MKHLLNGRCPRCRKADIFCTRNPYDFKKLFLIHRHCDACGLIFNREPGFFYGSMYVGYALSVSYLTTFYVAMVFLIDNFELFTYFAFAIGSLVVLSPVIFRFSRSLWLSFFVRFDPSAVQEWEEVTKDKKVDNPCLEV